MTNERGHLSCAPAAAGQLPRQRRNSRASRSTSRRASRSARGQTAVINVTLSVGALSEVVPVTGESPIAQPGKIDLGRTISAERDQEPSARVAEPVQLRVPAGERDGLREQRVRRAAHQRQRHARCAPTTRSTATPTPRRTARACACCRSRRCMVQEVKVITNGFAPEFGQTTGMVYNAITPSGTNDVPRLGELPLPPQGHVGAAVLPGADGDEARHRTSTTSPPRVGGPVVKDKWHFYGGVRVRRSRPVRANQRHHRHASNARRSARHPSRQTASSRRTQNVNFAFGKADYQVNPANRLSVRYLFFQNSRRTTSPAATTTTDRATDFMDRMDSVVGPADLDGRHHEAQRVAGSIRRAGTSSASPARTAGTGPAITVSGAANFGGPLDGAARAPASTSTQGIWQVLDNFTWIVGQATAFKAGIDVQFVADERVNTRACRSTRSRRSMPTTLAKSGANPFGYTTTSRTWATRRSATTRGFYGFFVQDDWQLSPQVKLLVRPALRRVRHPQPPGRSPPNPLSSDFKFDKNNFAPRVGPLMVARPRRRAPCCEPRPA